MRGNAIPLKRATIRQNQQLNDHLRRRMTQTRRKRCREEEMESNGRESKHRYLMLPFILLYLCSFRLMTEKCYIIVYVCGSLHRRETTPKTSEKARKTALAQYTQTDCRLEIKRMTSACVCCSHYCCQCGHLWSKRRNRHVWCGATNWHEHVAQAFVIFFSPLVFRPFTAKYVRPLESTIKEMKSNDVYGTRPVCSSDA